MLCCGYEFRHFTNNQFEYIPLKWIISVSSWNDHNWLLPLIASLFLFTFSLVSPFISSLSPSTTNNNKKRQTPYPIVCATIYSIFVTSFFHSFDVERREVHEERQRRRQQYATNFKWGDSYTLRIKMSKQTNEKKRNTFGVIVLILGCHPNSWYWIIHAAKEQGREKDRSTCHIQSKLVQMCKGVW